MDTTTNDFENEFQRANLMLADIHILVFIFFFLVV